MIDETQEAEGDIIAGERLVVCGLGVVEAVFTRFDWRTRVRMKVADGDPVAPTTTVATVRGPAAALLAGERTALNFLQRLSGIATLTQAFVGRSRAPSCASPTRARPCRARARWRSTRCASAAAATTAPISSSGILIKDNHVALCGSVREAVRRARATAPHSLRIGVEVDTLAQLDEAIEAGAEVVLLDNFSTRDLSEAVRRVRDRAPRVVLEASGGVTLDRIREIAKTGVDVISIGALTHSARAVDFSFSVRPAEAGRGTRASDRPRRRAGRKSSASASTPFEPLDAARVARALTTRWLGRPCECLASCGSTNDVAAARGRAGAAEGLVIITDEQTGGRGRLGRSWHATPGANLTFSVLLRPARPPVEVPPLTLLAGAAVARGARAVRRESAAEMAQRRAAPGAAHLGGRHNQSRRRRSRASSPRWRAKAIASGTSWSGIGLNVNETALPPELAGRATSMALAQGRSFDRVEVLDAVLWRSKTLTTIFGSTARRRRCAGGSSTAAIGTRARVRVGEHDLEGEVLGLDPDGALRIAADDGRVHRVVSGEIT